jgi:hypothetical protein
MNKYTTPQIEVTLDPDLCPPGCREEPYCANVMAWDENSQTWGESPEVAFLKCLNSWKNSFTKG